MIDDYIICYSYIGINLIINDYIDDDYKSYNEPIMIIQF